MMTPKRCVSAVLLPGPARADGGRWGARPPRRLRRIACAGYHGAARLVARIRMRAEGAARGVQILGHGEHRQSRRNAERSLAKARAVW